MSMMKLSHASRQQTFDSERRLDGRGGRQYLAESWFGGIRSGWAENRHPEDVTGQEFMQQ